MEKTRRIFRLVFFALFFVGVSGIRAEDEVTPEVPEVVLQVGVDVTRCYLTPPVNCKLPGEIKTTAFKIRLERWQKPVDGDVEFWNGEARQWFLAEGRPVLFDVGATKVVEKGVATYSFSFITITQGEDNGVESLELRNIKDLRQLPEVLFNGVPYLFSATQRNQPVFLIAPPQN